MRVFFIYKGIGEQKTFLKDSSCLLLIRLPIMWYLWHIHVVPFENWNHTENLFSSTGFFINWCETIGPIFNQTWQTLQGIDKNKAIWSLFVWICSIHLQILVNLHSIVIIYNINKQDVYIAKFIIVGGLPDRIDVWYWHQEVPVTKGVLECISSKSKSEITFALFSRLWDWSISWLWRKKIVVWC